MKSPDSQVVASVVDANQWFHAMNTIIMALWTIIVGTFMLQMIEPGTFKEWQETAYFCVVTGTTVGYGDVSPQTAAGKIAVTIYALFSLQVFADVTSVVGDALKRLVCRPVTRKGGKEL